MRPEHRFSKELTRALESLGCLVLPIETGPTNRGVPDLYIAKSGDSLWCELKVVAPKQTKEPRSPIQIKRQAEMVRHGVAVVNARDIRDGNDKNHGYHLDSAVLNNITELALFITNFLEA